MRGVESLLGSDDAGVSASDADGDADRPRALAVFVQEPAAVEVGAVLEDASLAGRHGGAFLWRVDSTAAVLV